ncbi:MAG TPA: RNA polymerase sigma factor RpoD/SigA [Phycisphaerales bacterium]|nr:RNA polymerase sigma factor RpoD/SigA [Phycisphaerales bacterium]HMP35993.1 RNA polymerase sigma factor RpoD/SigA [Phycisphaerales bacterium]
MPSELETYLRQINGVPLLKRDEERMLGWRVVNDGDDLARERLITANLRLVVAICKQYANRGMPLADLIEEGNVGLIRAASNYDPAQGVRFSTYAAWWIKQAVRRLLAIGARPIHIPLYMIDLINRLREASARLEAQLRRAPTTAELARAMRLPDEKIDAIRVAMKAAQCPAHAPRGDDGEPLDFAAVIPDSRGGTPDERLARREDLNAALRIIDSMDEREAMILRLRFGLGGLAPKTLTEIGAEVGLTRERVRQLELRTLRRLQEELLDEQALPAATQPPTRRRRRRSAIGAAG